MLLTMYCKFIIFDIHSLYICVKLHDRVFAPDGNIMMFSINKPGTKHDSTVFKESAMQSAIEILHEHQFCIVGDSGFKRQNGMVTTRNRKNETQEEGMIRSELLSARVCAEHGNAALKNTMRRLKTRLTSNDKKRQMIIEAAIKLYTFILPRMKRSEIAERYGYYPKPIEVDSDDEFDNNS